MSKNTVALSATGQAITAGSGTIRRLIVGTHSSAVIRFNDSPNSATGRVILNDYPVPAGAQSIQLDLDYTDGVFATLVSGTGTFQLSFDPTVF
jgi:hypothetical protein